MAAAAPTSGGAGGARPPVTEETKGCKYVCAVCMSEVELVPNQTVMCPHCAHSTSTSKVFFKQRERPTNYSTV